jgi:hypothetical protein
LNDSEVECFQGIKLNTVDFDVECVNNYTFTVTDFTTDSYKWIEAEEMFGNNQSADCGAGGMLCSKKQTSIVNDASEGELKTNPGEYNLWVRCVYNSNGFKVKVNGVETKLGCNSSSIIFNWSSFGMFNLTQNTMIGFNKTTVNSEVDAMLLTTNLDYDPAVSNIKYFGNPNVITKCLIGNVSLNVTSAVSSSSTASFSERIQYIELLSGKQPYLPRSIRLKVVIWKALV